MMSVSPVERCDFKFVAFVKWCLIVWLNKSLIIV